MKTEVKTTPQSPRDKFVEEFIQLPKEIKTGRMVFYQRETYLNTKRIKDNVVFLFWAFIVYMIVTFIVVMEILDKLK